MGFLCVCVCVRVCTRHMCMGGRASVCMYTCGCRVGIWRAWGLCYVVGTRGDGRRGGFLHGVGKGQGGDS